MSIFSSIVSRIFRGSTLGAQAADQDGGVLVGQTTQAAPATETNIGEAATRPLRDVDVEAVLSGLAAHAAQPLDWRRSIVDLMKLLDLESGLPARKELAKELGYSEPLDGSAAMNLWLHRAVMERLAANGGRVPDDLRV